MSRIRLLLTVCFISAWRVIGQGDANNTNDEPSRNSNTDAISEYGGSAVIPSDTGADNETTPTSDTPDDTTGTSRKECRELLPGNFIQGGIINGTKVSLLLALPLTYQGSPYLNPGFYQLAASIMAINHFNARNSAIVPELASPQMQHCPIEIDFESLLLMDTGTVESNAMNAVWERFQSADGTPLPSAIVGPYNVIPANELSVTATTLRIPMISHRGIDHNLHLPEKHPFANQINADLYSDVEFLIDYLVRTERTNFITILYDASSDNAVKRVEAFRVEASRRDMTRIETFGYVSPTISLDLTDYYGHRSILAALEQVKATGFRTIVWITPDFDGEFLDTGHAAHELQLDQGDHLWVIPNIWDMDGPFNQTNLSRIFMFDEHEQEDVSFLLNAAYLKSGELFHNNTAEDHSSSFLEEWMGLNDTFIEQLLAINPIEAHEYEEEWNQVLKFGLSIGWFSEDDIPDGDFPPSDLFARPLNFTSMPSAGTVNVYDAIMAVGIGACNALDMTEAKAPDATVQIGNTRVLVGDVLQDAIRSSTFHGASGKVLFGDVFPGNRVGSTVPYVVTNLFPDGFEGELFRFTDVRMPGGEWLEFNQFIYVNGSAVPPLPLREPADQNYLSPGLQSMGFAMMGIALLAILISVVWIFVYWNHRVVAASQPVFLLYMLAGATISSLAIVTISFDESDGWSAEQLTGLCLAAPWFVFMGQMVTYNALFTKMWRVHEVLQFSRRQVKISHVIWPALILEVLAVVLLAVWTATTDYSWDRVEIEETTGESIGLCTGDPNSFGWWIGVAFVTFISMLLTGIFAWKTMDVDESYSEAKWIFGLMLLQTQVILVGVPTVVILDNVSADGRYIGSVMMFWSFPMTVFGLIMVPKMYKVHFPSNKQELRGTIAGVKVSGVSSSSPHASIVDRGSSAHPVDRESVANCLQRYSTAGRESAPQSQASGG